MESQARRVCHKKSYLMRLIRMICKIAHPAASRCLDQ